MRADRLRGLLKGKTCELHSAFMVVCGWVFAGGLIDSPLPWLISLPMGFSVLAAIVLAGIPDKEADQSVGKKTSAVTTSTQGAAGIALVAALLASVAVFLPVGEIGRLFENVHFPILLHAAVLGGGLIRYLAKGAPCRRIDGLLFLALSFILWFSIPPLLTLW